MGGGGIPERGLPGVLTFVYLWIEKETFKIEYNCQIVTKKSYKRFNIFQFYLSYYLSQTVLPELPEVPGVPDDPDDLRIFLISNVVDGNDVANVDDVPPIYQSLLRSIDFVVDDVSPSSFCDAKRRCDNVERRCDNVGHHCDDVGDAQRRRSDNVRESNGPRRWESDLYVRGVASSKSINPKIKIQ